MHRTEDQLYGSEVGGAEPLDHRPRALDVVGAVDPSALGHTLPAPRPTHACEVLGSGPNAQGRRELEGHRRVRRLVLPGQRERPAVGCEVLAAHAQTGSLGLGERVHTSPERQQPRPPRGGEGWPTGAKQGRFLPRDGIEARPQHVLMVEIDGDDGRGHGVAHIRRVQPAAEADLPDDAVDLRILEGERRHGPGALEERGVVGDALRRAKDPLRQSHDLGPFDVAPVDTNPFPEAAQVWRGEQTDPQAARAQQRLGEGRRAPLPVRAPDEHTRPPRHGPAERGVQSARTIEPVALTEADAGEEVGEGRAVGVPLGLRPGR